MRAVSAVFRLVWVCAFAFVSVSAFAQGGDVGSIVGAITDKSEGALAGATVIVTDTQRGVTRTLTTGIPASTALQTSPPAPIPFEPNTKVFRPSNAKTS